MVKTPKPEALKRLQGNAGKRAKRPSVAEAQGEAAPEISATKLFFSPGWEPASWLADGAKRIWCELLPIARRETKLQESGLQLFAAYCDALYRLHKYSKEIEDKGATYTTDRGFVRKRPEVEMRDRAANDVRNFASELNLTPKSWIGSMGTFAGRQLDMFMHGGVQAPAAPAQEQKGSVPVETQGIGSYLANRPTIN